MPTPENPETNPPPPPASTRPVPPLPATPPPGTEPITPAKRPRWPWILGGVGCLALVVGCIVGAIFFTKMKGIVDEARTRASHLQASKNKLVGSWKKPEGDATVQTFNGDGTLLIRIFGTNLGKPIEIALTATYRVDGDQLFEVYKDARLVTKVEHADIVEPMIKSQMAKQLKFGETQKAKLTWTDANTFTISETGLAPQVWKRQ